MKKYVSVLVLTFTLGAVCAAQEASIESGDQGGLEARLREPVSLEVNETYIGDVLESIAQEFQINLVLDSRSVAPKDSEQIDPDIEYASDGVVQYAKLEEVPLADGLGAMLKPLGLEYSVQPEFIWVTTPERVRHESFERLETRTYNVNGPYVVDVNATARSAAGERMELVWLISHTIPDVLDPSTGEALSSVIFNKESNQLSVQQIPTNLKKVESLLEAVETTR